jgi:hypothetical protein
MANLNTNILILFGISAALAFFFPMIRDGVAKQLSAKGIVASLVPFLLTLLPFAAMFGLAAYLQMNVAVTAPAFFGASLLGWLLGRVGLPPLYRGILLASASVAFTCLMPSEGIAEPVAAAMLGLLATKFLDNLFLSESSTYEDVVPPLAWLGGVLWLALQNQPGDAVAKGAILLGTISVCFLLRVVQRPFMTDDRWLVKRVMLSATGGLAVLLVMTKIMLQTQAWNLALLVAAGMFCSYLFQNVDAEGEEKVTASIGIQELIVIGLLTLVANRFFGTWGMLVLVPAAILPVRGGFAQFAGMFFLSRVLLQGFVNQYNANVTGINLTHAYTGAALYAGFIVMGILFMMLRDITDRRIRLGVFLAAGALVPMGANFYLHAEPTSSLLVAATIAGVMFAALGPSLQRAEHSVGYGNLLLVPAMMSVAGITYGGLIEAGISATNETRLGILGGAVALALVTALVGWLTSRNGAKKQAVAAE